MNGIQQQELNEQLFAAVKERRIEAGAGVDIADEDEITPLQYAAKNGHTEIVKALIEAGAGVDIADEDEITPLQYAAENSHTEIVKALIEAGADVNIANKGGKTPLYLAAKRGWIMCSETIIKYDVLFDYNRIEPDFIANDTKLSQFWKNCKSQTEKMQNNIGKSIISYYGFLREVNENKLASYLSNKNTGVLEELEKAQYKESFSIYADIIEEQLNKGKKRKYLLDQGNVVMDSHNFMRKLPEEIRSKITESLTNADLENLEKSAVNAPGARLNDLDVKHWELLKPQRNIVKI